MRVERLACGLVLLCSCALPAEDAEHVEAAEGAVTSGSVTTARPEIGLVHVDGTHDLRGDMGYATGTVVLARNIVLTSAKPMRGESLPRSTAPGTSHGTFTITHADGRRSVHAIVETAAVETLGLLRIDPPASAEILPATMASEADAAQARTRRATVTFYGYGYRNLVCVPLSGSDGQKSFVTRRFDQLGGLFTGPLGVGYTCEGDIGGPVFSGAERGTGLLLAVNADTIIDRFDAPGHVRARIDAIASAWR